MSVEEPLPVRSLDRCLACGGARLRPLAMTYEFHGRFPLVECGVCGMRFLSVQPTPEGLARLYSSEYFERDFRCGRSDVGYFSESAFRAENDGLLNAFERLGARGRLLEVGCAGGWLLQRANARGWQAEGVELSAEAVAHARGLGLEVFHGELSAACLPGGRFDLVYLGDVLEHVPDCRTTLEEVARVLKPGGHLYLRGPLTTNSLARALALALYGAVGHVIVLHEPPYHLWEFTPRPLARLLAAVGFDLVALRQSKIPPGHAHGEKSKLQRAVMAVIDAINVPITRAFNVAGDRVVVTARRSTPNLARET